MKKLLVVWSVLAFAADASESVTVREADPPVYELLPDTLGNESSFDSYGLNKFLEARGLFFDYQPRTI